MFTDKYLSNITSAIIIISKGAVVLSSAPVDKLHSQSSWDNLSAIEK